MISTASDPLRSARRSRGRRRRAPAAATAAPRGSRAGASGGMPRAAAAVRSTDASASAVACDCSRSSAAASGSASAIAGSARLPGAVESQPVITASQSSASSADERRTGDERGRDRHHEQPRAHPRPRAGEDAERQADERRHEERHAARSRRARRARRARAPRPAGCRATTGRDRRSRSPSEPVAEERAAAGGPARAAARSCATSAARSPESVSPDARVARREPRQHQRARSRRRRRTASRRRAGARRTPRGRRSRSRPRRARRPIDSTSAFHSTGGASTDGRRAAQPRRAPAPSSSAPRNRSPAGARRRAAAPRRRAAAAPPDRVDVDCLLIRPSISASHGGRRLRLARVPEMELARAQPEVDRPARTCRRARRAEWRRSRPPPNAGERREVHRHDVDREPDLPQLLLDHRRRPLAHRVPLLRQDRDPRRLPARVVARAVAVPVDEPDLDRGARPRCARSSAPLRQPGHEPVAVPRRDRPRHRLGRAEIDGVDDRLPIDRRARSPGAARRAGATGRPFAAAAPGRRLISRNSGATEMPGSISAILPALASVRSAARSSARA